MRKKHAAFLVGLIFTLIGLVLPFWPFMVLGILSCAFMFPFLAIILGALADSIFGTSTGFTHFVGFPFTIFGCFAALFALFLSTRLRSRKMY